MKTFLVLFTILAATLAHAEIKGSPFSPEADVRFNKLEENYATGLVGKDGHHVKQVLQVTYDFSVSGGAIGTITLPQKLPKGAIIQRSYVYSVTQPTTSASGTLAFQCQNSGDVLAATAAASFGAAGASIDGASTGSAANFKYITSECSMKAVIATGALTAGKVIAIVEYVTQK